MTYFIRKFLTDVFRSEFLSSSGSRFIQEYKNKNIQGPKHVVAINK